MTKRRRARLEEILRDPKLESIYRLGFETGARCAASLAAEYPTTHPYRLDDCILCKLNVSQRKKPRKRARGAR